MIWVISWLLFDHHWTVLQLYLLRENIYKTVTRPRKRANITTLSFVTSHQRLLMTAVAHYELMKLQRVWYSLNPRNWLCFILIRRVYTKHRWNSFTFLYTGVPTSLKYNVKWKYKTRYICNTVCIALILVIMLWLSQIEWVYTPK